MNKKVSVIMGVYNCESTIEQAINSIIEQTYQNWELIVCDDGSVDKTIEIVEKIAERESRIIILKNQKNLGLGETLNRCLEKATGDYIARMDGDDDCSKVRFEKQVYFLDNNPEYNIVGSAMRFFDEHGEWGRNYVIEKPTKEDVVIGSPICHATVMMRRKCIENVKGYTVGKRQLRVEDVDLWIKLYAKGYRCYNLQEPFYMMRNDKKAFSRRKYKYRINSVCIRLKGCKTLKLSPICYVKSLKPMLIGLMPVRMRLFIKLKMK